MNLCPATTYPAVSPIFLQRNLEEEKPALGRRHLQGARRAGRSAAGNRPARYRASEEILRGKHAVALNGPHH